MGEALAALSQEQPTEGCRGLAELKAETSTSSNLQHVSPMCARLAVHAARHLCRRQCHTSDVRRLATSRD